MRLVVVLHLDPCPQTQIELVERRHPLQIQALDQLTSKRSPRSLNLAFRWSVARTAVHQVNPELGTQQPQVVSAEAGMIIQQELPYDTATRHGLIEHGEETLFGFTKAALQVRNQPAPVVDES